MFLIWLWRVPLLLELECQQGEPRGSPYPVLSCARRCSRPLRSLGGSIEEVGENATRDEEPPRVC